MTLRLVWALGLSLACNGSIFDAPNGNDPNVPDPMDDPIVAITPPGVLPLPEHVGVSGLRRLTPTEYDRTLMALLGVVARTSAALLPSDPPDETEDYPFDNAYEHQAPSQPLIVATETLAFDMVNALAADRPRLESLVPCVPAGPGDVECASEFVRDFGRLAYRRPLEADEVQRLVELVRCSEGAESTEYCGFGVEEGDFYFGIETIVAAILVNPNFLYRVERGTPIAGVEGAFELNGYEIATRLSYFLWGETPDAWLLDRAAAGELDTAEGIRGVAATMLDDPRGHRQVQRMHAMWLHYEHIGMEGPLAADMQQETEALIERIVFEERRPWKEIFTATESFLTPALAEHYGLPSPGSEGDWVDYGATGRGGILAHGSFLSSVGAAGEDTSPVHRGRLITTILMCQPIKPPPMNIPDPPSREEVECKEDILEVHSGGACIGCHQFMDPIGLGLEAYDREGVFRERELDHPDCEISGEGSFPSPSGIAADATPFNGPAELGEVITDGRVQACAALQMYRYAMGHNIRRAVDSPGIHLEDFPFVAWLATEFGEDGRFDELLLDIVSSQPFRQRRDETVEEDR